MKIYPHGTRARYVHNGCKCLPCTDANRDRAREAAARNRKLWRLHRTRTGTYVVRNTDTGEIRLRTADRDEAFELRDRLNHAARELGLLPEPMWAHIKTIHSVRAHLLALKQAGLGRRRIAELAGLNQKTVRDLFLDLRPQRPGPCPMPRKRLKHATAQAILGVKLGEAAAGAYVPAEETWRLLDEMLAAGATKTRIARELGSTAKVPALQLKRHLVRKDRADAVQRLHDAFFRGSARMRTVCRCDKDALGRRVA